jgi:hypothetical protein
MVKQSIILAEFGNNEKLPAGPISPKPGPIPAIEVAIALKASLFGRPIKRKLILADRKITK